jgi:hypothetical protein
MGNGLADCAAAVHALAPARATHLAGEAPHQRNPGRRVVGKVYSRVRLSNRLIVFVYSVFLPRRQRACVGNSNIQLLPGLGLPR